MAAVSDEVYAVARIRNRRLFIEERRRFDESVARLDERFDYEVSVHRLYANRSVQQNRYYFGAIVHEMCEHTGCTVDDMHAWLKAKFIPKKLAICDGNGEVVDELVLGGSTRKMTTKEFGDYMDAIRGWMAASLGIVVKDPDEYNAVGNGELHGWGV